MATMFQTKNRACAFINSSNLNQMINLSPQPITVKIPFPPLVDPYDLVKTKDGKIPTRVPNAFLIYRKVFIETVKNDGYCLPMTIISSMASKSWEQESGIVKDEYKRLAKEAYEIRNEMLPKSQRKRKRAKWNIISFEKKTRKSPEIKTQEPAKQINESTAEIFQLASPITPPPEPQSINSSPIIPQSESFSSYETNMEIEQFGFGFTNNIEHMTPNVPSPEMLSIEEEIINPINSMIFPSPNLSNISSPELSSQYDEFNLESFSSDIIESPILTEEIFDLLVPINEDYHMSHMNNTYDGLGISDSLGIFAYNTTDTTIKPSCEMDFGHSYYL